MPLFSNHPRRFVPGRTGDAAPLGRLETAVMNAVWHADGPVQVSDILSHLVGEDAVAYNTVKTTLERLTTKGILSRVRHGKAYLYQAAISREELERRIVTNALDRLVEQFPQAVASFFVSPNHDMSEEQLGLLQEAIARKRDADGGAE